MSCKFGWLFGTILIVALILLTFLRREYSSQLSGGPYCGRGLLVEQLLQQIGKDSTDSYRVEMPFAEVAPEDRELWSRETTTELRVAVGRTGATKLQYLLLGQGTRQHGLIAGSVSQSL